MRNIGRLSFLFFFMLFLAIPVFGEEAAEDIVLTGDIEEGVVVGDVVSLDAGLGTITIKTEEGVERTFSVIGEETILWRGIEDIELADISTGEEAEVGYYTDENGKLIASWVDVMIEEEIVPLELEPEIEKDEPAQE